MSLSKRSNGVYYFWYFDDGGRRRKVTTTSQQVRDALRFAQRFDPSNRRPTPKRILLSEFFQEYTLYSRSVHRPSSTTSAVTSFREFIKVVGDLPIHVIGVREIERFIAAKKAARSAAAARVSFVTLASAFQTVIRWQYLPANPFRGMAPPRLPEKQPAFLSRDQFLELLKLVDNTILHDFYIAAVCTGMRLGELAALRWDDVDFENKVIHVRNTEAFLKKSGRNRVVPMNQDLHQVLLSRRNGSATGMVFQNHGTRLRKEFASDGFKRFAQAANMGEHIHFHGLRYTFASWLANSGVPPFDIQKLLGHSSIPMTQKYSRLLPNRLRAATDQRSIHRQPTTSLRSADTPLDPQISPARGDRYQVNVRQVTDG